MPEQNGAPCFGCRQVPVWGSSTNEAHQVNLALPPSSLAASRWM